MFSWDYRKAQQNLDKHGVSFEEAGTVFGGGEMARKGSASSARGARLKRKETNTGNERIDFTDIPELSGAQLKRAKRVGRPKSANPKQLIAIRVSPNLLYALRLMAKKRRRPYQTLMHELLERAVKEAA